MIPKSINIAPPVTRVEVIDDINGRVYSNWNVQSCELSVQDDERTVKLFITSTKEEEDKNDEDKEY